MSVESLVLDRAFVLPVESLVLDRAFVLPVESLVLDRIFVLPVESLVLDRIFVLSVINILNNCIKKHVPNLPATTPLGRQDFEIEAVILFSLFV